MLAHSAMVPALILSCGVLSLGLPTAPALAQLPAEPPASAGDSSAQGRALFKRAAENLAKAQTLVYQAEHWFEGGIAGGMLPKVTGTVRMKRVPASGDTPAGWRVRVTGQTEPNKSGQTTRFDVVWSPGPNSEMVTWVDHATRTIRTRMVRQAGGEGVRHAMNLRVKDWFEKNGPFFKESDLATVVIEPRVTVDGVECEPLVASGSGLTGRVRWLMGVEDFLPRRQERLLEAPANRPDAASSSSSVILKFGDIKAGVEIDDKDLQVDVPEGYTRDEPVQRPATSKVSPGRATPVDAAPAAAAEGTPVPAAQGETAPAFSLTSSVGQSVTLESLQGKPAALVFWGSWSGPSRSGLASIQKVADAFKDRATFVALAVREKNPQASAEEFAKAGGTFALLREADAVASEYKVNRFPTIVVLDAQGRIAARLDAWNKDQTPAELSAKLESLAAKP
ncbi:MAG: TlpA disulfide reductase family protein [Planctomycetota bacterium]|nr:TlpA disulfide reductase family protein [Planctomycetota bacterium]